MPGVAELTERGGSSEVAGVWTFLLALVTAVEPRAVCEKEVPSTPAVRGVAGSSDWVSGLPQKQIYGPLGHRGVSFMCGGCVPEKAGRDGGRLRGFCQLRSVGSVFGSQSLRPFLGPLWHTEAFCSRAGFVDVGMLLVDMMSGN